MSIFKSLSNGKVAIEDARVIYKNFRGEASQYNRNGDRNFAVVIDDENVAADLENHNWNIKRKLQDDGTEFVYLPVSVSYRIEALQPKIILYSKNGSDVITEETVKDIDYAEIESFDIVLRPRHWNDDNGEPHVKAYLAELRAILNEGYFDEKYAAYEHPEDDVAEEEIPF